PSVSTTYWSRACASPRTVSSRSTFSPQVAQMYCCFRRDWSFACSMLKCTAFDRDAGYTLTGLETTAKEIVPEDAARAGMEDLYGGRARERESLGIGRRRS